MSLPTKDELIDRQRAWKEELTTDKCGLAHTAQHAIDDIQAKIDAGEYLGARKRKEYTDNG